MLPYLAQGAVQAIEDAGVLTVSLSLADNIPTALGVYEAVPKSRGEAVQNSAATQRTALHLPDGPIKQLRGRGQTRICGLITNGRTFMWGLDVMKDTVEGWRNWVAKVERHHLGSVKAVVY